MPRRLHTSVGSVRNQAVGARCGSPAPSTGRSPRDPLDTQRTMGFAFAARKASRGVSDCWSASAQCERTKATSYQIGDLQRRPTRPQVPQDLQMTARCSTMRDSCVRRRLVVLGAPVFANDRHVPTQNADFARLQLRKRQRACRNKVFEDVQLIKPCSNYACRVQQLRKRSARHSEQVANSAATNFAQRHCAAASMRTSGRRYPCNLFAATSSSGGQERM